MFLCSSFSFSSLASPPASSASILNQIHNAGSSLYERRKGPRRHTNILRGPTIARVARSCLPGYVLVAVLYTTINCVLSPLRSLSLGSLSFSLVSLCLGGNCQPNIRCWSLSPGRHLGCALASVGKVVVRLFVRCVMVCNGLLLTS